MVDALTKLTYTTITGNLGAIVTDSADATDIPDFKALTGTVTFTPAVSVVRVDGVDVDAPRTLVLAPITATLDTAGDIALHGVKHVKLLALDNPYLGFDLAQGAPTYTVSFNVQLDGVKFDIAPYAFNTIAGATRDIAALLPVASSPGVLTIRGLAGPEGPAGDGAVDSVNGGTGHVILTLDDIADGVARAAMTTGQATKLSGIATGATANPDSQINTLADARIAASTTVVKTTGAQTVAGVKTFTSKPVVPDDSFASTKISGFTAAVQALRANSVEVRVYNAGWPPEDIPAGFTGLLLCISGMPTSTTTNPPYTYARRAWWQL